MLIRVLKVCWFMVHRIIAYSWRRLVRAADKEGKLDNDYLNWAKYVLAVFQVDLQVEGRAHIPKGRERKLVIMSNHQSQLDIPALESALEFRLGFVAKKELSRVPLLNYWMRQIGCVFIDRSNRRDAHRILEKAAAEMGSTPLVVFPEGTRSKTGELLPIKLGGCRLAILAEALILPILISGTRDAAENRSPGRRGSIPVRLVVFPTLDTRALGDGKAGLNAIKEYVESCWKNPSAPN